MSTKSSSEKSSTKASSEKGGSKGNFVFGKENYMLMIGGIAVIVIGFMLMAGGGSNDPKVFSPEIFSARRIILAPMVVLIGFSIEVFAIFRKEKE